MPSPDRILLRAEKLTTKHGVAKKNVSGAFDTKPSRQVEYLFHEVAHWVTLGHSIEKIPRRLSKYNDDAFKGILDRAANELEIDASLVTYLAGWTLGIWTDPGPIVHSCRRNMRGLISLRASDDEIYKGFEQRWREYRSQYEHKAQVIAKWFRPSAKPLPFPYPEFP